MTFNLKIVAPPLTSFFAFVNKNSLLYQTNLYIQQKQKSVAAIKLQKLYGIL